MNEYRELDAEKPLVTYLVTLDTPKGRGTVELSSFLGPEAAGRRARWTMIPSWGDVDEVTVFMVEALDENRVVIDHD